MTIDPETASNTPPSLRISPGNEAVDQLLRADTGFVKKYAFVVLVFLLLALVSLTWFISYPDVITAQANLVATNGPKELVCFQDQRVLDVFVTNNVDVNANQVLAHFYSNANHAEVYRLNLLIDSTINLIESGETVLPLTSLATTLTSVGELRYAYDAFRKSLQDFMDYGIGGYYTLRKDALRKDLLSIRKDSIILEQEKLLLHQDLALEEDSYHSNEGLYLQKVISKKEDRLERSKLINKQLAIPRLDGSILGTEIQKAEKLKEISELEHNSILQRLNFLQALRTLQSVIIEWIQKYTLIAPSSGRLVYVVPLQPNQTCKANRTLGYVIPKSNKIYSELHLSQLNFGKLAEGQKVLISLGAYSDKEFGFVTGHIDYISEIATDSGFIARVSMLDPLITNRGHIIRYREGLKGNAKIITNDTRLLQRLYHSFYSLLDR